MEGIFFPGSILYYAYGAVSLSSDPAGCSFSVLQMCDQPGSVSSCAPDAEIYRGTVSVRRDHIRTGREAVEGRVFYRTNSKEKQILPRLPGGELRPAGGRGGAMSVGPGRKLQNSHNDPGKKDQSRQDHKKGKNGC